MGLSQEDPVQVPGPPSNPHSRFGAVHIVFGVEPASMCGWDTWCQRGQLRNPGMGLMAPT